MTQAKGDFQNLNFELANPGKLTQGSFGPSYADNVPVANLLPYWSVYYGADQQTYINYNDPGLGSTMVTLVGGTWPPIDGNYSVLLQGGITASAASITQTALIPTGTESLFFEAQPGLGTLDVSIGSQLVSFTVVGSRANYTLYGANISAFSGDTEQLTFSALKDTGSDNNWLIDDITFSQTAVTPEPGTLALFIMAGMTFGVRSWRKRVKASRQDHKA